MSLHWGVECGTFPPPSRLRGVRLADLPEDSAAAEEVMLLLAALNPSSLLDSDKMSEDPRTLFDVCLSTGGGDAAAGTSSAASYLLTVYISEKHPATPPAFRLMPRSEYDEDAGDEPALSAPSRLPKVMLGDLRKCMSKAYDDSCPAGAMGGVINFVLTVTAWFDDPPWPKQTSSPTLSSHGTFFSHWVQRNTAPDAEEQRQRRQ
eukprot:PhM_4_TR12041/c0_g1_i1/m.53044